MVSVLMPIPLGVTASGKALYLARDLLQMSEWVACDVAK